MSERIQAAVGRIRAELDLIEAETAGPGPEGLAGKLLRIVRGEEPLPGSIQEREHSPGVVASQLASNKLLPHADHWTLGDEPPQVLELARKLLADAGYFPGYERPDGSWEPLTLFSFRSLTGLRGFTPDRTTGPEWHQKIRAHFNRYGAPSPYRFAREVGFYGLDPAEFYPHSITVYVRETLKRAAEEDA